MPKVIVRWSEWVSYSEEIEVSEEELRTFTGQQFIDKIYSANIEPHATDGGVLDNDSVTIYDEEYDIIKDITYYS